MPLDDGLLIGELHWRPGPTEAHQDEQDPIAVPHQRHEVVDGRFALAVLAIGDRQA